MRSRIPLVFAGLLIIALIAMVGLAAFTPGGTDTGAEAAPEPTLEIDLPVSGRIASAVLALAVAPQRDADLATSTTVTVTETTLDAVPSPAPPDPIVEDEPQSDDAPAETTTAPTTATTRVSNADTTPPALQVLSPKDGATVTSRVIEFSGVTEHGAKVFSGPFEAEMDDDGDWAINLVLAPGKNGAAFTARDAAGNETTVRIVVTYDPPTPATTTTKAPTTTTKPPSSGTTTTTKAASSGYSPLWPADSAGQRDVEAWRPLVNKYWAADRVECVLGIIHLESRGDPAAYNSRTGVSGLMQHLLKYWPSRARGAGFVDSAGLVATPFNAEANIAAGAYLAEYHDRIGKDWRSPWTVWRSVSACQS